MTPHARGLVAGLTALTLLSFAAPASAAPPGWMSDYRKALEVSRKHGKPIIADFSTDWCPNCRKLENHTFSDPAISDRLDQFVKVYIDGDRHPEMVERFGIEGFPTLVALSPEGRELDRSVGYVNARRLASTLDRAIRSVPPAPVVQPDEQQPPTAIAAADPKQGGKMKEADTRSQTANPAVLIAGAEPANTAKTASKPVTLSKLPEGANFYTMNVSREPAIKVAATAPRREFELAQGSSATPAASTTDGGPADLPRPLINVGRNRASTAESVPAGTPESKPRTTAKPAAEDRSAASAPVPESAAAPATPSVSTDPLATIRLLQSAKGPADARHGAPAESNASAAPREPSRVAATPAATAKPAQATETRATPKPVAAARPPEGTPPPETARSPSRDIAAPGLVSGRAATPPSREDAERWMKDGDEKLRSGRKKEARAQYAKIVETDPSNQTGYADVAFIKMVSLMVDRDDPALRQEAYSKISEFLARYPNSPHKDYYTVIRATLAIDLDRTEEAAALLQDFPAQYPQSRFTEMAYKLWTSLPATRRTPSQAQRRQ